MSLPDFCHIFGRLHREALKQSATDPKTGLIDINILTTGLSATDRKRRLELAKALRNLLQEKGKVATVKYQGVFDEIREASDLVSVLWIVHVHYRHDCDKH